MVEFTGNRKSVTGKQQLLFMSFTQFSYIKYLKFGYKQSNYLQSWKYLHTYCNILQ